MLLPTELNEKGNMDVVVMVNGIFHTIEITEDSLKQINYVFNSDMRLVVKR